MEGVREVRERGEAERSAKNHPIQGTNADILKYALGLLYRQLAPGVHVALTVHDEIVIEYFCGRFFDSSKSCSALYPYPSASGAVRGSTLRGSCIETRDPAIVYSNDYAYARQEVCVSM